MTIDHYPLRLLWFAMALSAVVVTWRFAEHAIEAVWKGQPMKQWYKVKTL